ncbi:biphenyl 2,3-dioxygenase ferredoxin reductase subunit (BphA4) [Pseudoxanthomonas spadix BD-a59]|uniref:Biphenyl 2,3-dioxygenase ferredoxin reductase subunit (BphA4) n=1 Tax=Pseudoxanthomonas spadix (strain BD-a59) TaxID=1045855 RepID=G7UWL0_PSEUP|nr:FAD-dependent oxidoreductase [Pseudoxanthomonas spadix]AER56517.1 biphenyl 2,3-dioxygenase ferredoxin reductase subunit (BphA4) [Pseudoxanthomonas spadix BD-a59]
MIEAISIIGAGLAGATAARALRAQGYTGRLHLVGDEPRHAYDRTTLSKAVLKGEQPEPPAILDASWYASADVDLQLGRRVSGLDVANREIQFESGASLAYDRLLLATGARPRRVAIPGCDLAGIHTLRDLADSEALRRALRPGQSLVIVGGGLIGCEVATTARKVGVDVTILEAGDELLLRVLGHRTGSWCRTELERMGVRVERNAQASRFEGEGQVRTVVCADGRQVAADVVLVSIGAEPADELARAAGIACARGVLVDATGASSCPEVFAAGDVAAWPLRQGGQRSLETYLNSQMEAEVAASAMLGAPVPTLQVPSSWTEIAGHRIQMIGDAEGPGEIILRGDAQAGQPLVLFRLLDGCVEAATAINATREFSVATRLVGARIPVSAEQLQDVGSNLRDLLKAKSS